MWFHGKIDKNSSMTQEKFVDYCMHFVQHLLEGLGKGGEAVILLFDSHASCWNLPALCYLMQNKVCPFSLIFHTAAWLQPNNNGPNIWFHKCVKDAIKRLRNSGVKNTVWFYNTVLHYAWIDFVECKRQEFANTGKKLHSKLLAKDRAWVLQPKPRVLAKCLEHPR